MITAAAVAGMAGIGTRAGAGGAIALVHLHQAVVSAFLEGRRSRLLDPDQLA